MPRKQKAKVEYTQLTKGIITESSLLNAPENSSAAEMNMNFNADGTRSRRPGMDWVSGTANAMAFTADFTNANTTIDSFEWRHAGNDKDTNFLVVHLGDKLYFYDLDAAYPGTAASLEHTETLTIPNYSPSRNFFYTIAYGKLFVTTGTQYVLLFEWDENTSTISFTANRLKVRDIWGVDDGFAVDDRTGALSQQRQYNLRNQGWPTSMRCAGDITGTGGSTLADPISYTNTKISAYPAHSDIPWGCKMPAAVTVDNIDAFSPWEIQKAIFGTTPAPKGKYIIDLFDRDPDRSSSSSLVATAPTIPTDKTVGYVDQCTSYAGRVWYSIKDFWLTGGDDNSPYLGNLVFYSQASNQKEELFACHTRDDITSEEYNQVLETDGGFVKIGDVGQIIGMESLGESLIVFGSNGVWEIFGGDQGFSATVQTVHKIYDEGCISSRSIVKSEKEIAFWSETGIHVVGFPEGSVRPTAASASEQTIDDLYNAIPIESKKLAVGGFDRRNKQFVWLYNSNTPDHNYQNNSELILDRRFGGFTQRSYTPINTATGPYPISPIRLRRQFQSSGHDQETALMYLVAVAVAATSTTVYTGGLVDEDFEDWGGTTGQDAAAYIITNDVTGGNSSADKELKYVWTKMLRTETDFVATTGGLTVQNESSCFLQAQWEWTNDALSGRWTTPQQVYRLPRHRAFETGDVVYHDLSNVRSKIRGSGDAYRLKYYSEAGKHLNLQGYGLALRQEDE